MLETQLHNNGQTKAKIEQFLKSNGYEYWADERNTAWAKQITPTWAYYLMIGIQWHMVSISEAGDDVIVEECLLNKSPSLVPGGGPRISETDDLPQLFGPARRAYKALQEFLKSL